MMYSGDCVMAPDARPSINAELIPTAIKGVRVQPDAIQRLTWLHEPPCPHAEQGVSRGWRQAQPPRTTVQRSRYANNASTSPPQRSVHSSPSTSLKIRGS